MKEYAVDDATLHGADILEMIATRIAEALHPQKIIVFGSWAREEQNVHSDIDLLIIQESDLPRPQRYAQVRRLFWGIGTPLDILVYTPDEFARYQDVPGSFTHTIAREGKVLYAQPGA
ncbi:MAG TPA: nucleotidyltransferase domain-containing protein [Anaerolineae bacterium]|nr:nucleotidyltransferase domain-containing protein [Anaerolineae bacterium]HQI84785.1 nucleotidyltransferase domain-containing protein [Anaerolineae bacterium]